MVSKFEIQKLIFADLKSDRTADDVTTRLLGEVARQPTYAKIVTKETGIFFGSCIFRALDFELKNTESCSDGESVVPNQVVASFTTSIELALTVERTLLNMASHLSGVATHTRKFVDAVKPFPVKILATRKTLPGIRDLQLMAVRSGGGFVHRRNLSDGILIKDNHISASGIGPLLKQASSLRSPLHRVEIEVQSVSQLEQVLEIGADIIMLDNFELPLAREAVKRIRQRMGTRTEIEFSGGVNLSNIRAIAEMGVDYISVGQITHSAPALNMSLDLIPVN